MRFGKKVIFLPSFWFLCRDISSRKLSLYRHFHQVPSSCRASQVSLVVKNPPASAGDLMSTGSIPGSGRSPGWGHGYPLQYSCLESPTNSLARSKLVSVQFSRLLSCVWLFATPWIAAHQASLTIINSRSPPKPMSIESVMPSNHLILCHPLLLLPSVFPSINVFSKMSALHIRWPKYWSFSFNISSSNEHPGLICFRMDWLDLLAVQGILKSLLQHHSSKASILWLIFLYSPTFTSTHDHWENHSLD